MILRSLELERFGPFVGRSFEFRRGLNLVAGANETGKTTLAAAVSGILFGMDDAQRLVPRGKPGACQAALTLENGQRIVRIARDLLTDEVELEERDALHRVSDRFRGRVPLRGGDPEVKKAYRERLGRFFHLPEGPFPDLQLRFLLGEEEFTSLDRVGSMLDTLAERPARMAGEPTATVAAPPVAESDPAALTAELERWREDYAAGVRYLDWARRQWQQLEGRQAVAPADLGQVDDLERRRQQLEGELAKTGLPRPLPGELPVLLAEAADIRQDLVGVGRETARLREELLKLPKVPWRLGAGMTLLAAALAAGAAWSFPDARIYALPAAGLLVAGGWCWIGAKGAAVRAERARLQGRGGVLEGQRADAQERLAALDERFEALGLSPSAVAVARMQKNLERGRQLLTELAEIEGALKALGKGASELPENLLAREELPGAEAKLSALAEKIRRREEELAAPIRPAASPAVTDRAEAPSQGPRRFLDPSLTEECSRLLLALTSGRYGELALAPDRDRLLVGQGPNWRPVEELGWGTRSAVLLALRLILLRRLQTTGALPLLLDEPCAGLDRERQLEAVKALERLSAAHQIILCSHDENLLKRAARDRWSVVSLEESRAVSQTLPEERNDDVGQLHLL